jgi:hypothetical protein
MNAAPDLTLKMNVDRDHGITQKINIFQRQINEYKVTFTHFYTTYTAFKLIMDVQVPDIWPAAYR